MPHGRHRAQRPGNQGVPLVVRRLDGQRLPVFGRGLRIAGLQLAIDTIHRPVKIHDPALIFGRKTAARFSALPEGVIDSEQILNFFSAVFHLQQQRLPGLQLDLIQLGPLAFIEVWSEVGILAQPSPQDAFRPGQIQGDRFWLAGQVVENDIADGKFRSSARGRREVSRQPRDRAVRRWHAESGSLAAGLGEGVHESQNRKDRSPGCGACA